MNKRNSISGHTPLNNPPEPPAHRRSDHGRSGTCIVSGRKLPLSELVPVAVLRPALMQRLKAMIGEVPPDARISQEELDRLRISYVSDLLKEDRGELTALEKEVLESLERNEMVSANIESEYEDIRTLGERLSDHLATFGGSWTFLIFFGVFLALWIALNFVERGQAFDPYPFILLNLILSCIAAIQAPIIMMSQKRQEAKDRLRSMNDYRINLKAELEIRHLHEKIDHILIQQWERLAEMQEIQIELLQELQRNSPKA